MRKMIKAPPTQKAIEMLLDDLIKLKEQGEDPEEIIKQSVKNNWKGLFTTLGKGTHKGFSGKKYIRLHLYHPVFLQNFRALLHRNQKFQSDE